MNFRQAASMLDLDAIRTQARADLVIITERGEEDVFLWEHSVRIAENAQLIARLPAVERHGPDELAILAAALYHDAGWAIQYRDGKVPRTEILARTPGDTIREQGALLMERKLGRILPVESLTRASLAIRSINDRRIEYIEGQVVADAKSLDELGLLALWPAIRRGVLGGKGVQAVIDTWHRRKEYQFWTAHLNDSFRFEPVRRLAEERLASYERWMEALEQCQRGDDVRVALSSVVPKDQTLEQAAG